MKAPRSYFQSIARTAPRGAVVLRPQSGILQRWQSTAASPWAAPADSPRRDAAGRAGAPMMTEAPASERMLASPPRSTPLRRGEEQGVPFNQSAEQVGSADSAQEHSAPGELAASVGKRSPVSAASESAKHSLVVDPLARIVQREGVNSASRAVPLETARVEPLDPQSAPSFAGDAHESRPPARPAAPRQAVATGEPVAPAKPAIHIGAIEVHVTPPPFSPPVPAARTPARAVVRKAPLSRGYLSRYGWDQA